MQVKVFSAEFYSNDIKVKSLTDFSKVICWSRGGIAGGEVAGETKKSPREVPWARNDIEEKFDMSYHRQSYCSLICFLPEKRG